MDEPNPAADFATPEGKVGRGTDHHARLESEGLLPGHVGHAALKEKGKLVNVMAGGQRGRLPPEALKEPTGGDPHIEEGLGKGLGTGRVFSNLV